jgi:hypothetical protein
MNSVDLIQAITESEGSYFRSILVRLPNGMFALIKSLELLDGEIVINTTCDAREVKS